jgi:DNA-binding transcriptional regulator GbsR (MarR family)
VQSPAGKILGVVGETPMSTQEIAKAAGLSYARTLKSLDKFKALGKVTLVKAQNVKFGEGKPPRLWIKGGR